MSQGKAARPPLGAPIALQILALLVGGLIIAQTVTVLVVLFVPPQPPQVYRLGEVAAALKGASLEAREARPFKRSIRDAPPASENPANFMEERERRILASLLGVDAQNVRLERPEVRRMRVRVGAEPGFAGADGPDRIERGLFLGPDDPGRPPPPEAGPRRRGDDEAGVPPAGRQARIERRRLFLEQVGLPPDGADPRGPRVIMGFDRAEFDGGRPIIGGVTAALRQPSGKWVVVTSSPEPFPNDWQRRVLVWFFGCMAVLAPVAYLFARRITAPISAFAQAADRIGRDPTAPPVKLSGPAEIGIAARAMNHMQVRLKRYVQDRTASIAAVSHDLRTPLARMRFKLEKAPPELQASLSRDVDQMEQMVCAVLEFIREGAEPRRRERVDLLSAIECVVDDAAAAGADVELGAGEPVIVEADTLGLERLFTNLIDNAAKYGRSARVTVHAEGDEGVVEIADQGPGLPASELEQVFRPFYRVEPSRNRETGGIGLGLAVARSIARAHGGDVSLASGSPGLIARVRLPLAPA
jgi:signal transduction histidine kinase